MVNNTTTNNIDPNSKFNDCINQTSYFETINLYNKIKFDVAKQYNDYNYLNVLQKFDNNSSFKNNQLYLKNTKEPIQVPLLLTKLKLEPYIISVVDYGSSSKAGQISATKSKINQDSIITEINFWKKPKISFFAVADGHGQYGEKVSQFLKHTFPSIT